VNPDGALEPGSLSHRGVERRWLLHRPARLPPGRRPLVLMFHGAGATADLAVRQTGWSRLADREGFLVAYPEGTARDPAAPPTFRLNPQAWNDGSGRGHTARQQTDDTGFVVAALDRLEREEPVDSRRVYACGFSNGASFAFRLGAELPQRFAAIAPFAGHCWVNPARLDPAVPLLYVAGDADPLNPIDGGEITTPWATREYHPAPRASFDRWAAALGFDPARAEPASEPGLGRWRHGPRADGAEAEFLVVEDLGHVWPGGARFLPAKLVGRTSDRLPGTEAAWAFLARHERN
jgi:polyhydroxybutyrate depolymerase